VLHNTMVDGLSRVKRSSSLNLWAPESALLSWRSRKGCRVLHNGQVWIVHTERPSLFSLKLCLHSRSYNYKLLLLLAMAVWKGMSEFVKFSSLSDSLEQGILKGVVSLYRWPPVWLVWNQLYDNWQFLFLFAKQTNPNQSNRRSMVQWYFPL
jgi:hypothetical protein